MYNEKVIWIANFTSVFFVSFPFCRLQKELMFLMMSSEKGISAFPDGENIFRWIGTITGPVDTVYAGHKYKLQLEFPNSYPYSAPVSIQTPKIFSHLIFAEYGNFELFFFIPVPRWSNS